jgi:hypothetical protein
MTNTYAGSDESSRIRQYASVVLAVLAAVAIVFSVNTAWTQHRVFDTDEFVETLAPLPADPAVSHAIATHAARALTADGTLDETVAGVLPDRLEFLAPKFGTFVEEVVYDTTKSAVASDAFATVWTASLRTAHTTIIGILDGDVSPSEPVTIDLDGAAGIVLDRLDAQGIDLFDDLEAAFGKIVLVQANALAAPRSIVNLFHTSVWLFPIIALLLLAAAVALDRDRFRPVEVFGFSTTVAILLSVVAVRTAANIGFRSVLDPIDRAAVEAIWDAMLNGFVLWNGIVGGVALLVGLGAFAWRFRARIERWAASMGPGRRTPEKAGPSGT